MNGRLSIAGRASHYGTQFWRVPKRRYPTREGMLTAHSTKAVNRRLVLPLDEHNWVRALEVLGARYARRGRTPDHYRAVVRNMVEGVTGTRGSTAATTQGRREMAGALDHIRESAYAEEIPTNASLWVTLVWAYCELGEVDRAVETYAQAQRRFKLTASVRSHMAELLVPALSRHGRLTEAEELMQVFERATTRGSSNGASGDDASGAAKEENGGVTAGGSCRRSAWETARMRQWLTEAAARSGDWRRTLAALGHSNSGSTTDGIAGAGELPQRSSVDSLFTHDRADTAAGSASGGGPPAVEKGGLTRDGLRQLFRALAAEAGTADPAVTEHMLRCWRQLYGDVSGTDSGAASTAVPASDLHLLMNGLAAAGRWELVLHVFATQYMGRASAEVYLSEPPAAAPSPLSEHAAGRPLDDVALNLVFSSFPRAVVELAPAPAEQPPRTAARDATLSLIHIENPAVVLRLLDDLLLHREDMVLTDHVMDTVAPALFQLGQHNRCLQLLRHSPAFSATAAEDTAQGGRRAARRVTAAKTPEERQLRQRLVHTVYAIHACTTVEMKYAAIMAFPFLFPPELLKRLPPPEKMAAHIQEEIAREAQAAAPRHTPRGDDNNIGTADSHATVAVGDDERYEAAVQHRVAEGGFDHHQRSRSHRPRTSATALLTEQQEAAMRRNFVSLREGSADAFRGRDPDADPRPIPKGLHDHASGWDFFGRGGEMVFPNNKKIPHPFSLQPKVMRSLADPYRRWNPRQNSSLAHKESVVKWNGKSSV